MATTNRGGVLRRKQTPTDGFNIQQMNSQIIHTSTPDAPNEIEMQTRQTLNALWFANVRLQFAIYKVQRRNIMRKYGTRFQLIVKSFQNQQCITLCFHARCVYRRREKGQSSKCPENSTCYITALPPPRLLLSPDSWTVLFVCLFVC